MDSQMPWQRLSHCIVSLHLNNCISAIVHDGNCDSKSDIRVITLILLNIYLLLCLAHCRGGLIKWADLLGAKVVADKLNGWAKQFEPAGLGGFFKPCSYLQSAADNNTSLEAGRKIASKM